MNRKEQIEEMAKIIDELYNVYDTTADEIAEGLYNTGYRKIPENAVVLTKEDLTKEPYNEFCKGCPNVRTRGSGITDCCADYNCRQFTRYANLIENYEQVRKETAKEIEQFKTSNQNEIDKINELQKEINALQEENRRLDEYVSCTLSAAEFDEEIKQAKIDVLNKLKRQAEHCDQWNCEVVPTKYLDEMIAEYENE